MHHRISVRPTGATCSCGHDAKAMTGAQALGNGYRHAHLVKNDGDDATVTDFRLCFKACLEQVDKPDTADDQWHHPDCYNHTTACCPL